MFERLYKFSTRFPGLISAASVVVVVACGVYAAGVFNDLSQKDGFNASGTEASQVASEIGQSLGNQQPTAIILFTTYDSSLSVLDPGYRVEVERLLSPLRRPGTTIITYYDSGLNALISSDRQSTFATVKMAGTADEQYERLNNWQTSVKSSFLITQLGGELVAQRQSSDQVESDLKLAEIITLPILALLLLVIFRGVIAAALPLILGIISIVGGIAVVRLLTHVTEIDQYSLNVITVLGLGLSVDYSLLMVSRFREELDGSASVTDAVRRTVMTAGRTIFFSGLTVIASLLSLVIFPIGFLRSIGLGGTSAIVVAVVAALVLLPALLMLIGHRINMWQIIKFRPRRPDHNGVWQRLGQFVTRRPLLSVLGSGAIIMVLAWPVSHLVVTATDYKTLPAGASSREVAQSLATNFGANRPPIQVLFASEASSASAEGAKQTDVLVNQIKTSLPHVASIQKTPPTSLGGKVLLNVTYDQGSETQFAAQNLVAGIRGLKVKNGTILVGGKPAFFYDTNQAVIYYLPIAISIIAVAMFVLLGLLLRSIIIPLQAIIINSFGLLASFGVLVFVFQDGNFTSYNWLSRTDGLTLTIPILVFGVAFGLSMDYAAFLYSRMREEFDKGAGSKAAITQSLDHTGSIITAAALLLFVVVAAFMSSKVAFLQQVGVGLSVAVVIDAFVIRLFLVPSIMTLLGKLNWYAPKWMARWRIRHN